MSKTKTAPVVSKEVLIGAIFLQGMAGLYSLVLISFCMSLMFPTIYGITLEYLNFSAT